MCFEENSGTGATSPAPRRCNLLTGECRALGKAWGSGYLEGEDYCCDSNDFALDFDDRGMDGNWLDGTDWGRDDGQWKCGSKHCGWNYNITFPCSVLSCALQSEMRRILKKVKEKKLGI